MCVFSEIVMKRALQRARCAEHVPASAVPDRQTPAPPPHGCTGSAPPLAHATHCLPHRHHARRFDLAVDRHSTHCNSLLCAPMFYEGKVIAVLQLINKYAGQSFTRADEVALSTYGQQAGCSLTVAAAGDCTVPSRRVGEKLACAAAAAAGGVVQAFSWTPPPPHPGRSLRKQIFLSLRTALKDRPKRPTANHQLPPTAASR